MGGRDELLWAVSLSCFEVMLPWVTLSCQEGLLLALVVDVVVVSCKVVVIALAFGVSFVVDVDVVVATAALRDDSVRRLLEVGLPLPPRTVNRSSLDKPELRVEKLSPSKAVAPAALVRSCAC